LLDSIEIDLSGVGVNALPSINSTCCGIRIDVSIDDENAFDSIRFNDDGDSNKTDESDLQFSKHDDSIIST
jgi:hypothetical protein